MLKKVNKLLRKHHEIQLQLNMAVNRLHKVKTEREEVIEELAIENPDSVLTDRKVIACNRQIRSGEDKISNLESTIKALDKAINHEMEKVHKNLGEELAHREDNAQHDFERYNKQHLDMLKRAKDFEQKMVTPSHQKRDRLRHMNNCFKIRDKWTPEQLLEAIKNPELFLENITIGEVLGFKEEIAKIQKRRDEAEKKEKERMKRQKNQSTEEREVLHQAKLILLGKRPMPDYLKPYMGSEQPPIELLQKLLLTVMDKGNVNRADASRAEVVI